MRRRSLCVLTIPMSPALVCVIAMGVAVGCAAVFMRRERSRRSRLLRDRPVLTDDEVFDQFYGSSHLDRASVIAAWTEIASILHVDRGRLRPADKLSWLTTTRFQPQSDLDDLETWLLTKKRHSRQHDVTVATIDDLVRCATRIADEAAPLE